MIRTFENRAEQKISGFQSPAADYLEGRLDIASTLVVDPHSTFYFQMKGDALASIGIHDGDILIIDRSLNPKHGAVVVAFVNGNFTCRIYQVADNVPALRNDNDVVFQTEINTLQVWGVVTSICRNVLPKSLKNGKYRHVCAL
ncbi:LexA family protein [Pedobacter agri]|uniref:LexA family protein n=1 Tax=Pedobacter agri TaxID=454586 RepID=UPI0029305642|nr:S24 family peptidase [Pedobacter agri]